jgi:hypothetical protein
MFPGAQFHFQVGVFLQLLLMFEKGLAQNSCDFVVIKSSFGTSTAKHLRASFELFLKSKCYVVCARSNKRGMCGGKNQS